MADLVWLESLLKQKESQRLLSRIISVGVRDIPSNGDFYMSHITTIDVQVLTKAGERMKISLIKKKDKRVQDEDVNMEIMPVKKEVEVYQGILEKFDQLMAEYDDNNEKLWCKMIGFKPYTVIIFENIKAQNFRMANRIQQLDLNHALVVMHGLGRFHALGHVLLEKKMIDKKYDFSTIYMQRKEMFVEHLFQNGIKQFSKAIEKYWPPKWKEAAVRLAKQQDVTERLRKLFAVNEKTFLTVCHGDCWTCNLMFKYCPHNEDYPIGVKFLDFQTTFINSYIFDLLHFLTNSVRFDVYRANIDQLLSVYQKSLHKTLAIYGMEKSAPTMQHIQAEAKRIEYYSFVMSMTFVPLNLAEEGDALQLDFLQQHCRDREVYRNEIFYSDRCQQVVGPIIQNWIDKGVI